jgi:hypothetical protein
MNNQINCDFIAVVLFTTLHLMRLTGEAQGTSFSYQGTLNVNGKAANGNYDMVFSLFPAAVDGTASAGPITNSATVVSNGLFMTTVDFGTGVFIGTNYWLDISVSPSGSNTFTELTRRQAITPNPYAIYSESAGSATTASTSDIAGSANSVSAANIVGTMQVQQLPVGVVMNNQKGVTLSGTFSGNGSGLMNVALLNFNQTLTGVNVFTNNVVIGTPAPFSNNLQVRPAANRLLNIYQSVITSGMTIDSVNDANTVNEPLEFRGSPNVFTTGNVGIGTTTPFRVFQVRPAPNSVLGIFENTSLGGMTIESVNDANSANQLLEFRGSPNVFTTGNVGIGITNPANALAVNGTVTATALMLAGNFNLPSTTSNAGIIYSGGGTLIQAYATGNFFAGVGAGNLTMSGVNNIGIGNGALASNTTGSANSANGYQALFSNTTGGANTADGYRALYDNTVNSYNTAIGFQTLYNNSGNNNTAIGSSALQQNTSGSVNTACGAQALQSNTTGSYNSAVGDLGLFANTTGYQNTANGYGALQANTTGIYNTANGANALQSTTTGGDNTASGQGALYQNTTGSDNTASGFQALLQNTNGIQNTANGSEALRNNTTGNQNTANGVAALEFNTIGNANVANGVAALQNNTTGIANTANGYYALFSNTSANDNTAEGFRALYNNTTGTNNVALGCQAGYNITTGSSNIDIGNMGFATDTNIIRIGSGQTQTFIAGVIIGNGAGLTNLNVGQLPGAVLTNNANGVTLSGTFSGNAAGLTNISPNAIVGGLTINLAVLVPSGGTNTLCFTNGILMSIQ